MPLWRGCWNGNTNIAPALQINNNSAGAPQSLNLRHNLESVRRCSAVCDDETLKVLLEIGRGDRNPDSVAQPHRLVAAGVAALLADRHCPKEVMDAIRELSRKE